MTTQTSDIDAPECIDEYTWHRWSWDTGGCRENPGVWSMGGTTIVSKRRCIICGCGWGKVAYGSQRNPNDVDGSTYSPGEFPVEACEAKAELRRQRRNLLARRRRGQRRASMHTWMRDGTHAPDCLYCARVEAVAK